MTVSRYRGPVHHEVLDEALVLGCLRRARRASVGLLRVPDAVAEVLRRSGLPSAAPAVKEMIVDLAREGRIELQPESGLGRLSPRELALCPDGPQGTKLSWARLL